MGKTTLCDAIMGLAATAGEQGRSSSRAASSSARPSYKIARAGIGYVPQGRRLFPSLTVDEHLKITGTGGAERTGGPRIASTTCFPDSPNASATAARSCRAASSRCSRSVVRFSTNPRLLIMDEPSEGLAPTVIEALIETLRELLEQEGLAILLIEQNLGVATALAERQLIMVGGRDRRRDHRG